MERRIVRREGVVSNESIGIAIVLAVAILMIGVRHFSLSHRGTNRVDDWPINHSHRRGA